MTDQTPKTYDETAEERTTTLALGPDGVDHSNEYQAAYERMEQRFITAAGGKPPTQDQRDRVGTLQAMAVDFAAEIELRCPDGRNKSLALTHLEDALMRANRAIFATGPSA